MLALAQSSPYCQSSEESHAIEFEVCTFDAVFTTPGACGRAGKLTPAATRKLGFAAKAARRAVHGSCSDQDNHW